MAIVKINDCGGGVNKDLMPEELPENVWTSVQNMRFRNGFAQKFGGIANIFDAPTVTPYYVAPYTTQTTRYIVHAGTDKVFVDDGTTRTDITPASDFTGTQDDRWSGGAFNGILLINNSVEIPHYWDGNIANNLAALTGWNANWRCKFIKPFKNYVIAGNITKSGTAYPSMVKWSDEAVPGAVPASWDETDPALNAGEQDLGETPDVLIDAMQLGDQMILYKERSMYAMQFIGAPFIFRFQRLPGDDGILSRGCVTNTPKGHVVLTSNDVVIHQGQGTQSIADGRVRQFIFDNLNKTVFGRAFVCTNPPTNEVFICFPSSESENCDLMAVWNWKDNTWGFRTLTNVTYGDACQINTDAAFFNWSQDSQTWADDTTTWSQSEFSPNEYRLIFARTTAISAFDISTQDDGVAIPASLERTAIQFGDPYSNKLIRSLYPRIDAPAGTVINVSVGGSMTANTAPTYSTPVPFTVGSQIKIDSFATGRFLAVKFESTADVVWRIRSYDIDLVQTGAY